MAIPMITARKLDLPGIAHGFFTRKGGVSTGLYASLNCGVGSADDPQHVRENRSRVAGNLGVPADRLVSLYQIHSADVLTVDAPSAGQRPKGDGMVTDRPGIALAVGMADCGPVLFADPRRGVIGAAHAGWGGAFKGVLEATVAAMERLGAVRRDIVAVLGPTISQPSYEVGPEFETRFAAADPANRRFFVPSARADHFQFDLPAYILSRLARMELGAAVDLGLCTYRDPERFFSFRRSTHRGESDYGRMLAGISLEA